MMVFHRNLLFQGARILRFHVNLQGFFGHTSCLGSRCVSSESGAKLLNVRSRSPSFPPKTTFRRSRFTGWENLHEWNWWYNMWWKMPCLWNLGNQNAGMPVDGRNPPPNANEHPLCLQSKFHVFWTGNRQLFSPSFQQLSPTWIWKPLHTSSNVASWQEMPFYQLHQMVLTPEMLSCSWPTVHIPLLVVLELLLLLPLLLLLVLLLVLLLLLLLLFLSLPPRDLSFRWPIWFPSV